MSLAQADAPAARLLELLADREWRLDNLYYIQDEAGCEVLFKRNEAQRAFWSERWFLNCILKARQLGFSTEIAIIMLDACLFNSNTGAGIIDYTLDDAKLKLGKIKFAYRRLPEALKARIPLTKENESEVEFDNGSSIRVGTSHRGGTLQILHVSEYGKISAERPDRAKEIKTGAFGTVHQGQFIYVESTAEGIGGEFHDLVQRADAAQKQGKELTPLDFKLHFFPWWRHKGYRMNPATVVIPKEMEEYFEELEQAHAIRLNAEQKAWYAKKREQIGPDEVLREYPSHPDEAFKTSVQGAYFKKQMARLRSDKRLGVVPFDPLRKVNTFWDIGIGDWTCIWFHQSDGVRHRLIDYIAGSGESVHYYIKELNRLGDERGYQYGVHYGPHDLMNKQFGDEDGRTIYAIALALGFEFEVVPRVSNKMDSIEAARGFLEMCWIDEARCELGVRALDNYRKEWDQERAVWKPKPRHDWASHPADSLQTGAMGFDPGIIDLPPESERSARAKRRRSRARTRSAWAR